MLSRLFIGRVKELNTPLREPCRELLFGLNPTADTGTCDDDLWLGFDKLGDVLTREPMATPAVPRTFDATVRVDNEIRRVAFPVDDERAE